MLNINNIHTYYGNIHALKGVTMEVSEGEIITLIGANGAGKTTTLMSISGVVPISEGEILFEGEPIHTKPPDQIVGLGISQVPEGRLIFPGLTVMESISRSLMAKPRLLLMDEPSLGLAPIIVERIFDIIRKINLENGTTIFLVEQNANMALQIAHRGYVMENGRISLVDSAARLAANEDVKKAYLGI